MTDQLTAGKRYALSAACIAAGGMLLLVAAGIIPTEDAAKNAPDSILGLCGLIFTIAGFMVLFGQQSRINDLLAGILCLVFGVVGGWVSLYSSNEGFSGGIPFVAYETNVKIARAMFGLGALICFSMSAWAFRRFFRAGR